MPLFLRNLSMFVLLLAGFIGRAQSNFVPGELLVQLKPHADLTALTRVIEEQHGLTVNDTRCISPVMNIYLFRFDPSTDLDAMERQLRSQEQVSVVQKNHYVFDRETIPSDTLFDNQWHLKNTGQTGGINDADIDAPEAWDITTGGLTTHGDTIVVCIIESGGFDINHIDLKDNHWKNYGEIENDGIDNDNNGYIDDYNGWNIGTDDDGISNGSHGTRVAGMVGATGNNITGVSGVNWDVKLMVVQGQSASNEATVIEAYTYPLVMRKIYNESNGQEGAFVVTTNSSWGIDGGDPADSPLWCSMYDSLGYYGILNIAATTNNDDNVDVVGDLPTTCASQFLVGVTMSNSQDLRAGSGYGTTHVDLAAPGSAVQTTSPGNFYFNASGTSFATPCVAGCVALAYSAPCHEFINLVKYDPAQAALAMRAYILNSVDVTPVLMTEVASGGRMNVKNAIDSILSACDPSTCYTPYNLVATAITDSVATLTWDGFSTDYVVYLQEGTLPVVELDATGTNSLLVDSLKPCTYYTTWVVANCGADSSNVSFSITFETDGCCNNPSVVLDSKTASSLTVSWSPVLYASNYDLRYKPSSDIIWTEQTGVSSPYLISGLLACTDYDVQIKTTCADSTHGYDNTFTFRTAGCGACTEMTYCDVTGANSNTEWIQSISLNGFLNTTGNNDGWLQSEQIIAALTPGATYSTTLTPGYTGFNFTEGFSIWIDLDHDGTFEASEMLLNNQTTSTSLVSSILIPVSATIGVTKMRIGMSAQASGAPVNCPTLSFYGEFEDYCVYIGPQSGLDEQQDHHLSVYPNPATAEIFLESDREIRSVCIVDGSGKIVVSMASYENSPIDIRSLERGLYFIHVTMDGGITTLKFIKS
jgi:serine protease